MSDVTRGIFGISAAPLFFIFIAVCAICPPLLLLVVPLLIGSGIAIFHKPKAKPQTFETWWDDNWQGFL